MVGRSVGWLWVGGVSTRNMKESSVVVVVVVVTCVRASLGPLFRLCLGGVQLVLEVYAVVCCVGVGAPTACPRTVAEGREWCRSRHGARLCSVSARDLSWCWPGVAGSSRKELHVSIKHKCMCVGVGARSLGFSLGVCPSLSLCVH
jgi:hypothetical protein